MTSTSLRLTRHAALADRLRADILRGVPPPGAKMPAERQLCAMFGASRVTVRRALLTLQDERLIVRRHGSGTYVSAQPERRIPLMIDYTGSVRDHAPSLQRRLLGRRRRAADRLTAEALELEEGDAILYAERVDALAEQPVAWDQVFIPLPFAGRLRDADLARMDFAEAWSKACRFTIASCRQTVEAVAASAAVAGRLGLRRGSPALKATDLYIANDGRPAGLFLSHYHPARICITSQHRWAAPRSRGR